jgi:ADP-heptose:LPS heptosyltransferase
VEILILHPGGLGDSILALPAISLLRKRYPSAGFTIAGNVDHLAPIARGYAELVISLATLPLHRLYTDEELPLEEISFWKSYSLIVSWTGSGDSVFARRLREIQPHALIGAWKPGPDDSRHVSQLFVESLGIEISPVKVRTPARILIDSILRDEGRQWLFKRGWNGHDPIIAIHPGAGSRTKRWPLSQFIDLARHLAHQEKRTLLIIEGPAEPGLAHQITQALSTPGVIPIGDVPLNLLAAVIKHCCLFVGNDSGLAHLAAALEVPCIALFGPTLPCHWAPLGSHVTVLRNPRGCEGCASDGNNHTCMDNITIGDLIPIVHARLQ